jgi:3-methyl-2-oxobutanoate hydroxymethyltransferase
MSKFTATSFAAYKAEGKRVVMCTAYTVAQARIAEAAGVDAILVGDSLGNTILGYGSTLPVTMDDMVRSTQSVVRGAPHTFVVADLPFMSYQASYEEGMRNAGRLIKEGGAQAVKLEGASVSDLTLVEGLVAAGIPVVGHLGLTPQSVNAFGGFKAQAKQSPAITELFLQVADLSNAGASAITLECIPTQVAERIAELFTVPTIGIGAGPCCDGEVQVFHDLCGLGGAFKPRHAKRYIEGEQLLVAAMAAYAAEVRETAFPTEENVVKVSAEEVEQAQSDFFAIFDEAFGDDAPEVDEE